MPVNCPWCNRAIEVAEHEYGAITLECAACWQRFVPMRPPEPPRLVHGQPMAFEPPPVQFPPPPDEPNWLKALRIGAWSWAAVVIVPVVLFVFCCLGMSCMGMLGSPGSKVSRANYGRIQDGMTIAQVESILGPGRENIRGYGMYVATWESGSSSFGNYLVISVSFQDGRVVGKACLP
jgi:hypothetical protein